MLNLADCLVAGFIFLLFVSIYRKKSSAAVRFWTIGWFCVLLHFCALASRPRTEAGQTAQCIVALVTLMLCGTAFALSHSNGQRDGRGQAWIAGLLGVPWVLSVVFAALSDRWFAAALCCAIASHVCVLWVCARVAGVRSLRFLAGTFLTLGCGAWLGFGVHAHDPNVVPFTVLTLCFGLHAVLLNGRQSHITTSSLTIRVGAVAWALVWAAHAFLDHVAPHVAISPEIWNLPKYFVAAGMVLSLLDEEIRATKLGSQQYRLLFEGNPHPMWIYDPETLAFLEVNNAAVVHYGYSRPQFKRMNLLDVMEVGDDTQAVADLRAPTPQMLSGPWLHRRSNGTEFQVDIASQPLEREGHRVTFALMHDVTEPRRLQAQLIRQAHHDVLTGLPNRAFFEERLKGTLEVSTDRSRKVALFCIDLDRFKQINDTFGHSAGDRCLCELARRITARLGGAGTLARTGGDEFMLVLGDLERAEMAEHLATLLLYDLKTPLKLDTGEVELVVSVGIAVSPEDGLDSDQLWRDADAAMYRAKRAGGSQWVRVSREISRIAVETNEIESSLKRALKAGGLVLWYQPQMAASGELHCLEALVRFTDPVLTAAKAQRVISIAEESGLIVPLGEWVLEEVCRQSRAWMDEGLPPVQIALNVSPLQLNRLNFSLKVAATLERYRLAPRMLEFEVTESTVMPDKGAAPEQIAMLAGMGIRFSVDDFGTGYSSLGRLHQLPVEALKIDRSFTRHIGERKGTYPTVRAIIALAHTFGLQVVAEGVETEEQLRILRALQCDRVQGFLFSEAIPADAVKAFLTHPEAHALVQGESFVRGV